MPFLGRNMGLVTSMTNVVIGITILVNYPYRDGITATPMATFDPAAGAPTPKTIALTSSYGYPVAAVCLAGGLGMMYFEKWTWGGEEPSDAKVEPKWFQLRAAAYGGIAVPGLAAFFLDDLMPPLLPSIFGLITAVVSYLASVSTLPSQKDWLWKPIAGLTKDQKQKKEEQGGVSIKSSLMKLDFKELDEQGLLPRVIFLASYIGINLIVGLHAYYRHALSEKGKALMGLPFLGCPVTNREYGEGGISPLPVCWIMVPCSEPSDGWKCPSGNPPIPIPAANPPLLQTFWIGFGWLGYPGAKMMGQLLNLNCAILLSPVTHSLVTKMHDLTSIYGPPWLHWLSKVIPFDKAIVFHKACAKYFILPMVFIHAVLHYFNYGRAPYYNALLGNGVYPATPKEAGWGITYGGYGLTGQVIVLAMFFIYCGAHEKVKRAHYETFWNTHHCFIIFFTALYFHGSVFWQWAIVTTVPYFLDRVLVRIIYRGRKPFALARVFIWGKPGKPDVISLQFENSISDKGIKPMDYMEGHYLYLQCPHLETKSKNKVLEQWHPFTIASAPDDPVLEVHIRVNPSPHSWTNQMAKYMSMYDPHNTGAVEFVSRNATSGVSELGKVCGADGLPFFHVDGPHGAPSQHVFCYNTAMIVGAGIGVTPCSSIMRGVVRYRWKKGYTPNNLYFFWVARLSDLNYFKWLLVMLPDLKAQELIHNEYYKTDSSSGGGRQRRLEITLYLTGAKKEQVAHKPDAKEGSMEATINALLAVKDDETGKPLINLKPGRPDWPGEFTSIAQTHGREDVGVIFCGAPMIAAALKENCEKLSNKAGTVFRLHKENF